jgi:hypothetical protein
MQRRSEARSRNSEQTNLIWMFRTRTPGQPPQQMSAYLAKKFTKRASSATRRLPIPASFAARSTPQSPLAKGAGNQATKMPLRTVDTVRRRNRHRPKIHFALSNMRIAFADEKITAGI